MRSQKMQLLTLVLGITFFVSKVSAEPLGAHSRSDAPDVSATAAAPGDATHLDWWQRAILWVPNRILDFIDIFRVDVGVGPAAGGVVRLSSSAQFGYRTMQPFSLRLGDFGREAPIKVETQDEYGAGESYTNSEDRPVCRGEVGIGLDLLLVSGYMGICFDQVVDFGAGLIMLDPADDDYDPEKQ